MFLTKELTGDTDAAMINKSKPLLSEAQKRVYEIGRQGYFERSPENRKIDTLVILLEEIPYQGSQETLFD